MVTAGTLSCICHRCPRLFHLGKTTADRRFDRPFRALDPIRIPAWPAFWRDSSQSLINPKGKSTLGIVGSIVFCSSLLRQANACFTMIAIDQCPPKAKSSPPLHSQGNFARCSSQCYSYREFKNKKGREPQCIPPFPFPSLKPFPFLISIIRTRTLSDLFAKMKDIYFCMIITHIESSLALLPSLFVCYCIYLH